MESIIFAATGQEWLVVKHQCIAIYHNLVSWTLVMLGVRRSRLELCPSVGALATTADAAHKPQQGRAAVDCVQILAPGGFEQFQLTALGGGGGSEGKNDWQLATVGYNVSSSAGVERLPGCASLVRVRADGSAGVPDDCALVRVTHFSVNYADVTIRWGLYESALRYVGYPIVPGFDFAGVVEAAGAASGVRAGQTVFGITFFGAYTARLVVPGAQLRPQPARLSRAEAAALPSVAGTALHALALAGFWPSAPLLANRAVLIHSAAGGVGSMLVQMARLLGAAPIVAVVGAAHKVETCRALGAHAVIDKSSSDLWAAARRAAPGGFAAIFDANGVATLADSYRALARTGRLVIYGFHTNLPSRTMLSPLAWARMAWGMARMPRFDPMDIVLASKAVLGFNLSFFADERALVDKYLEQIVAWADAGELVVARTVELDIAQVPRAHELIQSGQSIGKIVIRAAPEQADAASS